MSRLSPTDLHGFAPAVVTPFDASGAILEENYRQLVEYLIGIGATAICVAGDNGESWSLSSSERGLLVRLAVDQAAGRVPVMAGIGAPTAQTMRSHAAAVIEAGARGLLAMPQTNVLKASRNELLRRFEQIAEFDTPVVVYNSPRRTGYEIGLETLEALLDVAPVIGIKESTRDFFLLSHLIHRFRDRISVMVGPCPYILPGLALGAAGFIATGPEFFGKEASRFVEVARAAPETEFARIHIALTEVYEALMGTGTWPSSLKAALALKGLPAGMTRDPVLPLEAADTAKLREVLARHGLLAD